MHSFSFSNHFINYKQKYCQKSQNQSKSLSCHPWSSPYPPWSSPVTSLSSHITPLSSTITPLSFQITLLSPSITPWSSPYHPQSSPYPPRTADSDFYLLRAIEKSNKHFAPHTTDTCYMIHTYKHISRLCLHLKPSILVDIAIIKYI